MKKRYYSYCGGVIFVAQNKSGVYCVWEKDARRLKEVLNLGIGFGALRGRREDVQKTLDRWAKKNKAVEVDHIF